MRIFPVQLPSGGRYWTVLDDDLCPMRAADRFLRDERFGRDRAELTVKAHAGLPAPPHHLSSPRPSSLELAVLVTAGLAAEHDWDDRYGIDLEDLGATSLRGEPNVRAIRDAANLLGEDYWIAVRRPGEFEGDGEAEDGAVVKQWTTVVVGPDELTWLDEALRLNDTDDGLDPPA